MAKRSASFREFVPAAPTDAPAALGVGDIEHVREELSDVEETYVLIEDVLAGENKVKSKRTTYLPLTNTYFVNDAVAQQRYDGYIKRAIFYNATAATVHGMIGQVFLQEPVVKLPTIMDIIKKDATGTGRTLKAFAKSVLRGNIAYGRGGIFVDYPDTGGRNTTLAEQRAGNIRPTMTNYGPRDIRNWAYGIVNGAVQLTRVVLREYYDRANAQTRNIERLPMYRELRLQQAENGAAFYTHQVFRPREEQGAVGALKVPTMGNGKPWREIPFKFYGAEENSAEIQQAPTEAIARINIGHYRNSADYEDSVFMVGQPTPVIVGIDKSWTDLFYKDGRIALGANALILLPEGGNAFFLETALNEGAKTGMEQKEKQMVSLGARLVETINKGGAKTATEAGGDMASETSILTTITDNVSECIEWALECAAIFMNVMTVRQDAVDAEHKIIQYKLNTDFAIARMNSDQIRLVVELWQKGAITDEEMRAAMTKTGYATFDIPKWRAAIESEAEKLPSLENEKEEAEALNDAE